MICDECLQYNKFTCKCIDGKAGIVHLGLAKGCTYYNEKTKTRCKKRVNEDVFLCESHSKGKLDVNEFMTPIEKSKKKVTIV